MKKLLTVIISFFFLTSALNADVISEYISNLIPGDGDTEVSIDLRENYSPDFSILMVRELSSDTNENTFTPLPRNITPVGIQLDPDTGVDLSKTEKSRKKGYEQRKLK